MLVSTVPKWERKIHCALNKMAMTAPEELREIHTLMGEYDFILKIHWGAGAASKRDKWD